MIRTQIQLTEAQHRRLKSWAQERGISMAEAVRRCVTPHLEKVDAAPSRADRVREVRSLLGKYADCAGPSDVARRHDEFLDDGYGE